MFGEEQASGSTATITPEDNTATAAEPGSTEPTVEANPEEAPQEKLYNKQQIINMMKRRVERSHKAFFTRYKVADLDELDAKFALADKYNELNAQFAPIQARNSELVRENAFLRNNVNPDKYSDIVAYFKGNDLEFTEEGLLEALGTHPEWLKPSTVPAPQTTVKSFGIEQVGKRQETEDEKFNRIFGYK